MMYTELYSFEGTAATDAGKTAEAPQRARGYWEYPSDSETRRSEKREMMG